MPKGRQLVTYMFCGLTRSTSIEDVIPKWVRSALDPPQASRPGLSRAI